MKKHIYLLTEETGQDIEKGVRKGDELIKLGSVENTSMGLYVPLGKLTTLLKRESEVEETNKIMNTKKCIVKKVDTGLIQNVKDGTILNLITIKDGICVTILDSGEIVVLPKENLKIIK